uniref:Leucine-rich repeat-containing N-terminal plant-type domain-containing protein n=1 Tax=Grammatophora oceanica TaxID=210454 RepID=A0A7S1VUH8_9STRA|mmetsp:Transcript_7931/g.11586  ORF Transcript_7931/g.11586 Transcript_7931/m.11586 type:complete len:684 (+) Transcript_7931:3-2054(+)
MNLGGIVADAGVLTMMELQAGDSGRGSSSMYSGNSTPVSHSSRKKAGAAIGGGSVVGGGRHLRVDSHDFCDDNLSVATDATDRQVGGNGRTAKLHNQEMVDVSVDQEYGEFGETDPYSYKARKTLWGSSINTRDGILRDHGLAVFTTRRQKIRYYSIFACMMISLVVIIGVSVSVTQPGKNNGDEEDTREPLVPPTTTTTTTTDEQQQTPTDQEAMTATDTTAVATPPHDMCDYDKDDDTIVPTPQVQCFCEGGISRWKEGQLDKYQHLKDNWIESFRNEEPFDFEPDSCHSHNAALVWLASDDANYDSPEFFLGAQDRYTLAVLFQEWKGFEWNQQEGWLGYSSTHPCDWYGITCDDKSLGGKVTEVRLTENNLHGELRPELAWLEELRILELGENHLQGTIPPKLLQDLAPTLQYLSLSVNSLTGTVPREIGEMDRLVKLAVDLNTLVGTIPTELGTCTSMEVLQLWDNQFEGPFGSEHIGDMTKLRDLLLHNNDKLTGTISAQWALDAPHLASLDISATKLKGTLPTEFGLWTDLVRCNVENVEHLDGTIPTELIGLPKLQHLKLSDNKLQGELPSDVVYGTQLQTLLLNDNELEGTIPTALGAIPSLQTLKLYNNKLEGSIPTELASVATLTEINLSGNPNMEGSVPQGLCELRSNDLRSLVTSCGLECDIPACCTQCA